VREAGVLAAVAGGGRIPAPRVLYFDAAARPPFAVLGGLEGRPLDEVLADTDPVAALELAAACGTVLAAIHAERFEAPGFLGREMSVIAPMPSWAAAVVSALDGSVGGRLGASLAEAVRRTVETGAGLVEIAWSDAVLVHADFKPWNLLVRRGDGPAVDAAAATSSALLEPWRISGVLDWEFACAGCRLLDFATFLRNESALPAGYGDAFAAAYLAAGGSLPHGWRRLTRLIDLLNLLQMLAWVDDAAADELCRLVAETVNEPG
jgi:Ser/Thr protein kinase RdoA (MazF antagonist)